MADPVEVRERSLQRQLAGYSAAVSPEEARRGLDEARADLESGRGKGYGLGFGFIADLGDDGDARRFCFAVADAERAASIHVRVSGSRLATIAAQEESVRGWLEDQLYHRTGSVRSDQDRYHALVSGPHPLQLG